MRIRALVAAGLLLAAVGGAIWQTVQLAAPDQGVVRGSDAFPAAKATEGSKRPLSTRQVANVNPSTAASGPPEPTKTDPVERMAQRLARKGGQQLASLQRLCNVDDAGMQRAKAILADFNRELIELADQGRAGSLQPVEFASLERQALEAKAAAWCRLLREAKIGARALPQGSGAMQQLAPCSERRFVTARCGIWPIRTCAAHPCTKTNSRPTRSESKNSRNFRLKEPTGLPSRGLRPVDSHAHPSRSGSGVVRQSLRPGLAAVLALRLARGDVGGAARFGRRRRSVDVDTALRSKANPSLTQGRWQQQRSKRLELAYRAPSRWEKALGNHGLVPI